jgi:hypothetical protein
MPDDNSWPALVGSIRRTALLLILFVVLTLHRRSRHAQIPPQEPLAPVPPVAVDALGPLPSHAPLFERAFFINADDSPRRRVFMEQQLRSAGVRYERWCAPRPRPQYRSATPADRANGAALRRPALRGSPELLRTHARYFRRGVEKHLYANRSAASGVLVQWGTIGTYLSHHMLFEAIVRRWGHNSSASFLILQDDTQLAPRWLPRLRDELDRHERTHWERLLLVWWGLERSADCRNGWCTVRPPAGPTEAGPECCGKRFYHGLQAWLVRVKALRCLLRRLRRRHIKNIDAQLVQCACPRTYALATGRMLGAHLDRELGSERAAVNSVWRARNDGGALRRSAVRNLHKVALEHLADAQPTTPTQRSR